MAHEENYEVALSTLRRTDSEKRGRDTAGLAFLPYQLDSLPSNLPLHENTLRDITGQLLRDSIVWLLGYDARYKISNPHHAPIRAQAEGSHWTTGWAIVQILDAVPILRREHLDVVQEIERRLLSEDITLNPLVWLLDQAHGNEDGTICWYGKEYDTAIVTFALLKAYVAPDSIRSSQLTDRLRKTLKGALLWLYSWLDELIERGKVDEEAVEVLDPLIAAHGPEFPELQNLWPGYGNEKQDKFYDAVHTWLAYLEAGVLRQRASRQGSSDAIGDEDSQYALGPNEAYCLSHLVMAASPESESKQSRLHDLAVRAQLILQRYPQFLEEWLESPRDVWGGNLGRVWRLGTYVQSCTASVVPLSASKVPTKLTNPARAGVVLKVLAMVKNEFFTNGSIFHSVYPTTYFARSLIAIWQWPESAHTIMELYQGVLDEYEVGVSLDRRDNFDLRRLLIQSQQEVAQEKARHQRLLLVERKKRYGLLVVIWVVVIGSAVAIASQYLNRSDIIQFGGVAASVLAVILIIIEVLYLRNDAI